MPLANLRIPSRDIDISRRMPSPKKVDKTEAWEKAVKGIFPEYDWRNWKLQQLGCNIKKVSLVYTHADDLHPLFIVIDRTIPYVG